MTTIQSRVQHKRDTSSNWEQNNPVLLAGEIIIVDTNAGERRTKTGDGVKHYNELPFDDENIRNLVSSKSSEVLENSKNYTDETISDYLPLSGGEVFGDIYIGKFTTSNKLIFDGATGHFVDPEPEHSQYLVSLYCGYETPDNIFPEMGMIPSKSFIVSGDRNVIFNTGDIICNNTKISNVASPMFPFDVTNKQYVDEAISDCLPLSGGDIEGSLGVHFYDNSSSPQQHNGIVLDSEHRKIKIIGSKLESSYLDEFYVQIGTGISFLYTDDSQTLNTDLVSLTVDASIGISMQDDSGYALFCNNGKINGVGDPQYASDAANKRYVDEKVSEFSGGITLVKW